MNQLLERVKGSKKTRDMDASDSVSDANDNIDVVFENIPILDEERDLIQELAVLQREQNKNLLRKKIRQLKEELHRTKLEEEIEMEEKGDISGRGEEKKDVKKVRIEEVEKADNNPQSSGYSSSASMNTRPRKYDLTTFLTCDNPKSATFEELLEGALLWGIHQEDLTTQELKDYMGHLAFLAHHAKGRRLPDTSYFGYDADVRKLAGYIGMVAFRGNKDEYAAIHFVDETDRNLGGGGGGGGGEAINKSTWACLTYNYNKAGCTVAHCKYQHKCVYCGKVNHKGPECKSKKARKD